MATKAKKNINAFQEALLSNTKVLGKSSPKQKKQVEKSSQNKRKEMTGNFMLNEAMIEKLSKLSKKYGIKSEKLADLAIGIFIEMESFYFQKPN